MADADLRAYLPAHEQTYLAFNGPVLFAILHVMLTLSCLALAFLFGLGGTVALIAGFAHSV